MKSNQPVFTREAACQDCYRCLRECPVKAIVVRNGMAAVDPDRCIYCGTCIGVCPAEAKTMRDDIPFVKMLLATKPRIMVSLAPSHTAAFPSGIGKLAAGLRLLGFSGVSETAVGAHLISKQLAEWIDAGHREGTLPKVILSTACTAVVTLIRKHHPHLVSALSPFCSPAAAHSRLIRQENPGTAVVFIGPCPAKKTEVGEAGCGIDAVISFNDLAQWFAAEHIDLDRLTPEETGPVPGSHGALYPIEGGMIESIRAFASLPYMEMMTVSGLDSISAVLCDLNPSTLETPVFIELLACRSGCINGACMPDKGELLIKRHAVRSYADNLAKFAPTPAALNVESGFAPLTIPAKEYAPEKLHAALERVGKQTPDDELNCGGCGYPSCRNFARALLEDRAEPAMCVSYMRSLAMKKANAMIQLMPAGAVIVDQDLHIIECNLRFVQIASPDLAQHFQETKTIAGVGIPAPFDKYFSAVLTTGESIPEKQVRLGDRIVSLSVFAIEAGRIAGGIVQDITEPAVHKEQIISRAREVSKRQLTMVQQIASLLGENAADSETLLSEIIGSFVSENSGKKPRHE